MPGAAQPVFDGLSLAVGSREFVTFIGPSGCGKSTLLRLIAGLLIPQRGRVAFSEHSSGDKHDRQIGFVFQESTLVPWRNVVQNVLLPSELGAGQTVPPVEEAIATLRLAGLSDEHFGKRPNELSGGMKMRVSLARALVTNPWLLLLDEPFAALDDILRLQLQVDVRRIHNARQRTTILVTHNIQEAVFMSDRIVILNGQPASIVKEVPVRLPADRDYHLRSSPEFVGIVADVMDLLHSTTVSNSQDAV
jgi:NitT/TauT family transport system ATP-binding protein